MKRSAKGREINWSALQQKHATERRVGNSNKNVRGDLLDPKTNKVVKTKEELAFVYNKKPQNAVKNVPISETGNLAANTAPKQSQPPTTPPSK